MKFKAVSRIQCGNPVDTLVLAVHEGFDAAVELRGLDDCISKTTACLIGEGAFSGKDGELQGFRLAREDDPKNVILIGLGKEDELSGEKIRKASGRMLRECKKLKSSSVGLYTAGIKLDKKISPKEAARAVAEGAVLADYSFEVYKSEKRSSTINEIILMNACESITEDMEKGLKEGMILAEATTLARDMVNEPANIITPVELANRAEKAGIESGFSVEILDEVKIQEAGMKAFWEVGKGSDNPPRFIIMRYFGDVENKDEIIGLVGKALTYDSGGYALKSLDGMVNMKMDMAGSAAVIGAMKAIAGMKLKANVVGIAAACENMVSGGAYKNGDVIGSMAGKTIEIKSTDAEGRLTLADAVYYAVEKEGAGRIVDIATLTGAAGVALGITTTPVITNDDEFYSKLEKASQNTGEKIWKLPTFEEYRELINSDIADLKNSGGRLAGTITGGLFIGEFVKEKPWIHMDIAGTAGADKDSCYISKGATGVGVRTLYELIKNM